MDGSGTSCREGCLTTLHSNKNVDFALIDAIPIVCFRC